MRTGVTFLNAAMRVRLIALFVIIGSCGVGIQYGEAAQLSPGHVTQIVQDVQLLRGNAAARQATVNDIVEKGMGVKTGGASRAELTFVDQTITRLGANTVFSYDDAAREIDVTKGAILLQVPPGASSAKIKTATVSAAITGGTALFEYNPGFPTQFVVLEGTGQLCNTGGDCVPVHAGELITVSSGGKLSATTPVNLKVILQTSDLLTDFPPLPNLYLIQQVITDQQQNAGTPPPNPPTNTNDPTDQHNATIPPSTPPSLDKFGPPSTITTPDPYLITSGSQIQTDPTITTNSVTDQGKIYRGFAADGSVPEYLFGESPTPFDQLVFDNQNDGQHAVFKFADLQLEGDPTITIPSGSPTSLALVSVGNITSPAATAVVGAAATPAILTFAGVSKLDFITQAGSIDLGSDISFQGIPHLSFYARGSEVSLTLRSSISGGNVVKLYSEGDVNVNGSITANDEFDSLSEGNFNATGANTNVSANNIDIQSLNGNINIDASKFPNPPAFGGSITLNAAITLNLTINGGGTFGWDSLTGTATTINLTGKSTFGFSNSSFVTFTAGIGGIQASTIDFLGNNLTLMSDADINVSSIATSEGGQSATVSAGTSFDATGNVEAKELTAGTTVATGGNLVVYDTLTAGGNITVGGFLQATTIDAPSSVLTVQSVIAPVLENNSGAALQHTFNVDSIVAPNGIDFSGNQFQGLNGLSSGGRLTINATTLTFDPATGIEYADFSGAQAGSFGGGLPNEGGDGGVFIVNTTGDINVDNGAEITATTGYNSDSGVYSGAGGSVTLHSSAGAVNVNDLIQVSSDDGANQRQSASGGTISIESDLTTGSGISIGGGGQLLSLLNTNAPGPGGSITLSTMGADIVVNGTVRADFGTVTLDQNDPANSTPMITIDGATVQAATFNINGSGDLSIGPSNTTAINIFGGTWNVSHDITLNAANTTFAFSFALNATAGDAINFTGGSSGSPATLALALTGDTTFTAGTGGINAPFVAITNSGASLNLISAGSITAYSIVFPGSASGTIAANGGALTLTGDLTSGNVSALTNISTSGNVIVSSLTATNGTIVVGGSLGTFGAITAGSDVTAGTVEVSAGGITTPGNLTAGSGAIHPFVVSPGGATQQNFITANTIVSPNGIDFSGNQFGGIDGHTSGGLLTVNATSLTFDATTGVGTVNFNGANAGATDFQGNVFTDVGGDGGRFIVNATGDINLTSNSSITATTGLINPTINNVPTSGTGGTVELNSTGGTVTVDSTIQVSSADSAPTPQPFRASSAGGTIAIASGKSTDLSNDPVVAVNLTSSSQLLSLLIGGPGGAITVSATGTNSQINASGRIQADHGLIDIEHSGNEGQISLSNATLLADIIKVNAFGSDGRLIIGGGMLSADSVLKLYAPSSNGVLEFIANVTLSGGTAINLAATQITIDPGVTVAIQGNGGAAHVFTDHPDYNFTPGGGYTGPPGNASNGSFGGTNGADDPQPLANAPTFGSGAVAPAVASTSKSSTSATNSNTINVSSSGELVSMLSKSSPRGINRPSVQKPMLNSRTSHLHQKQAPAPADINQPLLKNARAGGPAGALNGL